MTKKKPGAVRGRPKGSGAGLDVSITVRFPPDVVAVIDDAVKEAGTERSAIVREIVGRWAKRRSAAKQ